MSSWVLAVCTWVSVLGSMVLKLPQLLQLLESSSGAAGVSSTSVMMETVYYSVILLYHIANRYTLLSYLEYTLLVPQDTLLLLLITLQRNNGRLKGLHLVVGSTTLIALASTLAAAHRIPPAVVQLLFICSVPIGFGSKVVQLAAIWRASDARGVSRLTWSMTAVTCLTRLTTTVLESADPALLLSFGVNLALNCVITASAYYHRDGPGVVEVKTSTPQPQERQPSNNEHKDRFEMGEEEVTANENENQLRYRGHTELNNES